MIKQGKSTFAVPALLITAVLICLMVSGMRGDISAHTEPEGFDTVLRGKDICTLAEHDGKIYAGGTQGLYEVDADTLEVKQLGDYSYVRAVACTSEGLWIGHEYGLTYLEGDTALTYTESDGLPDHRVNAIMLAANGDVWAGTWGGAVRFDGKSVSVYTTENGLLDNMVNVITQDDTGSIWFGSYVAPRGGISILTAHDFTAHDFTAHEFTADGWQTFTTDNGLPHANINAILPLNDGSVLVGGGLYTKGGGRRFLYKDGQWEADRTLTPADGLAGEKIRSLYEDSSGRLWVGSEYNGLAILFKESAYVMDASDGLANDEIKAIKEEEKGSYWIGTREGLTRIAKGGLQYGQ